VKKTLTSLLAAMALSLAIAQTGTPGQISTSSVQVRNHGSGLPVTRPCMLWLPASYDDPQQLSKPPYPLLVFLHGHGQRGPANGSGVTELLDFGPLKFLDEDDWDGSGGVFECIEQTAYIVFAFQTDEDFSNDEIEYALQQLILRYRIDHSRIVITGPSGGGGSAYSYAMDYTRNPRAQIMIPMSVPSADFTNVNYVATEFNMKVWAFADDQPNVGSFYTTTTSIVNSFNSAVANSARFTGRSLGHCCWNDYYDPDYTESDGGQNLNIYQWAMKKMPAERDMFGNCIESFINFSDRKFAGFLSVSQSDKVGSCNTTCTVPIYTDDGNLSHGSIVYLYGYAYEGDPMDGDNLHYGFSTLKLKNAPADRHLIINASGEVTLFENCIGPAGYISTSQFDQTSACAQNCSTVVYSNAGVVALGTKLYQSDGVTPVNGSWLKYGFTTVQNGAAQKRIDIDNNGIVITYANCGGGGQAWLEDIVAETRNENTLSKVFPNPVNGKLTIQFAGTFWPAHLQLYNAKGVLVYQARISNQTHAVNTTPFARGVYLLKIIHQSGVSETQKIIIQ